jgi:hypothetical protein
MTTSTDTGPSLETPKLSNADFDAIFKAEQKKLTSGDDSEAKRIGEAFFTGTGEIKPPAVEEKTEETQQVAETTDTTTTSDGSTTTTSEAATDSAASTTDGTSTSTTEGESTAATTDDWLSSLDPKIKGEVEKLLAEKANLEHRIKSDQGRVANYQRHYETTRRERDELKKQLIQPQSKAAAPTQMTNKKTDEVPAHIKAVMDFDEVSGKALLEEFRAREEREIALRNELETLKNEALNPLHKELQDLRIERELTKLEQERPGAIEVFNHPIWEDFKRAAPPWLRALAESDDRSEVITALDEYANWIQHPQVKDWAEKAYGAPHQQQQQQASAATTTSTQTTTQATVDPAKAAQAQKVKQEQERKASAQPVNSGAVGRPLANAKPNLDQILTDPKLKADFFAERFEIELAAVEGRKPRLNK